MVTRLLGRFFCPRAVFISLSVLGIIAIQEEALAVLNKIDLKALLELDLKDRATLHPEDVVKECTAYLSSSGNLSQSQKSRLHLLRGYAYLDAQKVKEAILDFEEAATLRPKNDFEIQYFRNCALGNQGLVQGNRALVLQAKVEAADLIKMKPDSAIAYLNLAIWLGAAGDAQGSITFCDKCIALDVNNAAAFYFRGLAHMFRCEYQEALEDLDNCIKLGGYAIGTKAAANQYILRAELLLDPFDNPDRAMRDLNMANRIDPDSIQVKFKIWQWYFKQEKYDIADHLSRRLSEEYPKSFKPTLANIARLIQKGNLNEAQKSAESLVSNYPAQYYGYYWRGVLHFAKGEHDDSLKDLEKASALNGINLHVRGAKAYLFASVPTARNSSEALKLAIKCCEQSLYKNAKYLMLLAMSHAAAGHKDEAVKFGKEALEKLNKSSHLREEYENRLKLFKEGKMYDFSPKSKVLDYLFF